MNKTSAKTLLIVFGNLLIFVVPFAMTLFPGLFSAAFWFILVFFAAHVVGSVLSCRRFKCRFGISPGKYIVYGAMPAFVLNVIFAVFALIFLYAGAESFGDLSYIPFVFSVFCGGYSTIYLIFLAASVSLFD